MQYFRLFWKKISKPCVKFSLVWTKNTTGLGNFKKTLKIFDENSIEKLNFDPFLSKFVAKNRALGNSIIFFQQFFRFGGFEPPNSSLRKPLPPSIPRVVDISRGFLLCSGATRILVRGDTPLSEDFQLNFAQGPMAKPPDVRSFLAIRCLAKILLRRNFRSKSHQWRRGGAEQWERPPPPETEKK